MRNLRAHRCRFRSRSLTKKPSNYTANRLKEIREKYGPDAIAIYGGASMITEKAYVLGKFARLAVGTKHIDYNGRLCMVSAGTAYKLTFGIDRATNPWPDLTKADVVLIAGSNMAECSPITTHYIWQMQGERRPADRGRSKDDADQPQRRLCICLCGRARTWHCFSRCCTSSFEMAWQKEDYIARTHDRLGGRSRINSRVDTARGPRR